jgi:release factor glutamine methyltransferase
MIIRDALLLAQNIQGSDSPRLDAELLLAEVLGQPRTYLYTWPERTLTPVEQKKYQQWLTRRIAGDPIAHIIQRREFWSLCLAVNASTLIPRPDTEILVERALVIVADQGLTSVRILDLGTGTGAIALALAKELPTAQIVGVDLNPEAIELAQRNGEQLGFQRVSFFQSSWFDAVDGAFDLIVSNPPYISEYDPHLDCGDVRFEPRSALVSGELGLADLKAITANAPRFLAAAGWLLLEHGWQQSEPVRRLLSDNGFTSVFTAQDYSGNDRVSGGQWRG